MDSTRIDRRTDLGTKAPAPLSLRERDRRYRALRERLAERQVDAAIVTGSNLLYLSNSLPGETFGLLPTRADESFTCVLNWRYLADIPAQVILDAQEWVTDVRAAHDVAPAIERLGELKLTQGTIGYAGDLSYTAYAQIATALPAAKLVDVSDIFEDVRTLKSSEEIAILDWANRIFDAAVERLRQVGRPGMLGRELVAEGRRAMWEVGGDLEATFKINFGPRCAQNPVLADLCLDRRVEPGDIGALTAHCHYRHYGGHTDQIVVFGPPKPHHVALFDAVKYVRGEVLQQVKPGATRRDMIEAYQKACGETGFDTSPHAQMHQYGIDIPEFPGPSFFLKDPEGRKPVRGGGNFTLRPGMIYSIAPTLVDKSGEAILGGGSLVITDDGYQDIGMVRPVEMVVAG